MYEFMRDQGIHCEDELMRPESTAVFYFPMQSPPGAVTRATQGSAIQQLEMWLFYQRYWCEHKPSVTISVKEDEWLRVGAWVYDNFDYLSGLSFLPYDTGSYKQAPYQEISADEYERWIREGRTVPIDWSLFASYERSDSTSTNQTLACTSDGCEMVDIVH